MLISKYQLTQSSVLHVTMIFVQLSLTVGKNMEIHGTIAGRRLSVKIALQIAEGLAYLHSMEITHADLKPANVLVFSKDVDDPVIVKITDYGISRNMDRGGSKGRVGTIGFRAPEIGQGLIFGKEVSSICSIKSKTCMDPSDLRKSFISYILYASREFSWVE